jgi:DNA-directed RNA polymerase subunit M/transcription elongation factor TFIIS
MAQELATIVGRKEILSTANEAIDAECPDCDSALTVSYAIDDRPSFFCENCEQAFAVREIGGEEENSFDNIKKDEYNHTENDNPYILSIINHSNRGFF